MRMVARVEIDASNAAEKDPVETMVARIKMSKVGRRRATSGMCLEMPSLNQSRSGTLSSSKQRARSVKLQLFMKSSKAGPIFPNLYAFMSESAKLMIGSASWISRWSQKADTARTSIMLTFRPEMISRSGTTWEMETRYFLNTTQMRTIDSRTWHFYARVSQSFSLWLLKLSVKPREQFSLAMQNKHIINMTRLHRSKKLSWRAPKLRSSVV